jgi:hypothetical protein
VLALKGLWAERAQRHFRQAFAALAILAGARAIGLTTWGVVCAADVNQRAATGIVHNSLAQIPAGSTVVLSSAYLYGETGNSRIRAIHPDWIAPYRHKTDVVDCFVTLRPARLILTQFDYYRGCGTIIPQLRNRKDLVEVRVTDFAKVRPPDSIASVQRIVQHISWAPVIVDLDWR